jgi:hypothetical protein
MPGNQSDSAALLQPVPAGAALDFRGEEPPARASPATFALFEHCSNTGSTFGPVSLKKARVGDPLSPPRPQLSLCSVIWEIFYTQFNAFNQRY